MADRRGKGAEMIIGEILNGVFLGSVEMICDALDIPSHARFWVRLYLKSVGGV
jgi:hypothetical protein